MLHEFAPAKINLYLHITGRQPNGYHDLDSLVVFAGVGDTLRLEPADGFSFTIEGPQAAALAGHPIDNNLVVKAARSFAMLAGKTLNAKLTLIKNLPIASGIGGGSSDAAAALRALAQYWDIALDDPRLIEAALQHGQDVPVCVKIHNNYMTATGTEPAQDLPHADIVLVNPNRALPTPDVYKVYREKGYSFSPQAHLVAPPHDLLDMVASLKARTNDLYEAASHLMPEIKDIIAAITQSDSLLARMSGSGATCFGLYADRNTARAAAARILAQYPHWWVVATTMPYKKFIDRRR